LCRESIISYTSAQRLWHNTKRITNYENSFSGIFMDKKAARGRENNVVATTPFLGGLQFKSQIQVGFKPYLRNFFDFSHPIMRLVRILVGWFAQWIDIMWTASDLTSDRPWT
jgi:hypothetical protein